MKPYRFIASGVAIVGAAMLLIAWAPFWLGPVGNKAVPQPAKRVDLNRYIGLWYEVGRYDSWFERGCEKVTAEYRTRADGKVQVINSCHQGALNGPLKVANGRAKVLPDSGGAKLKVSFFGPFYVGDYWVLDHADDYGWSIVGEPSGRYLWLLSREAKPSVPEVEALENRARDLGYDVKLIRRPAQ